MTTLPSVLANPPCAAADGLQLSFESCGPLELMTMSGLDFGTTYFYEATSGDLIAVEESSCIAGPPCLAIQSCGTPRLVCDAGADARAPQ
jgi:hypothetical protein